MAKKPDELEIDSEEEATDAGFTHARSVIERITGQKLPRAKNPAAVELGKLGASKGGKARAEKLTAKRRTTIAKKAASARWQKRGR